MFETWSRVLDGVTKTPIEGAKVELVESPHHTTFTDSAGRFRMNEVKNLHWMVPYVFPVEGNWPNGKNDEIEVTHTNYQRYMGSGLVSGTDILLQPRK